MPLYFFEIDTGTTKAFDDEGYDLIDHSTVPERALGILSDLARNRLPAVDRPMTCLVRNESGATIFQATLALSAGWIES